MNNDTEIFNLDESIRLAGGNRELAFELLNMLIDELPAHKTEIGKSLKSNDFDNLKHHVHKLHGSSRCCGTPALLKAAQALETTINQNNNQLENHMINLMTEIDRVLELDVTSLRGQ